MKHETKFKFNNSQIPKKKKKNFETTVNASLGFWSLSVLYFFFSFSNFVSSPIVQTLGERFVVPQIKTT